MNPTTNEQPNLYALLIGVDCYLPNQLPNGGWYPSLGGCVRDITLVEDFLRRNLGFAADHIVKLTATYTGPLPARDPQHNYQPTEPHAQWPTYANMVTAFAQVTQMAQAGDQVYIHYSGHGGRATTIYPELSKPAGIDEALVPTDIGNSEARYLRDVELAHLLQTMVDKGLLVTIVLDSCHSGGATRGVGHATARGIEAIDDGIRPSDSLVASRDELMVTWRRLGGGSAARNLKLGSGWLLEPQDYSLLAAARAQESAYETLFEDGQRHGVLTYWLLDTLKARTAMTTYQTVYNRVLAKVHSQFDMQTPQLQGEPDRVVFGSASVEPPLTVLVEQVEAGDPGRILVQAGQVQGLRKGAKFVVYPRETSDLTQVEQRLALAELVELGADSSWAKITKTLRSEPIEQGARAVVLDTGNVNLQRPVRLFQRSDLPVEIDPLQEPALAKVRQALIDTGSNFARLAGDDEPIAFQVAINEQGQYEIWDAAGNAMPNLRPSLVINDPSAPAKVAQRLIHLAKYRNVQELDNRDPMSPLAGKLVVELLGKMGSDYDPADAPRPQPFADPRNPTVQDGEWIFVRVRNMLPRSPDPQRPRLNTLNITVLDLAPDWSIQQMYPSDPASDSIPLDGESATQPLPLRVSVPAGYTAITDILKVFATRGPTSFRWLELPALDKPIQPKSQTRGAAQNPLEELLMAVTEKNLTMRNTSAAAYASHGWAAVQVEVQARR